MKKYAYIPSMNEGWYPFVSVNTVLWVIVGEYRVRITAEMITDIKTHKEMLKEHPEWLI